MFSSKALDDFSHIRQVRVLFFSFLSFSCKVIFVLSLSQHGIFIDDTMMTVSNDLTLQKERTRENDSCSISISTQRSEELDHAKPKQIVLFGQTIQMDQDKQYFGVETVEIENFQGHTQLMFGC